MKPVLAFVLAVTFAVAAAAEARAQTASERQACKPDVFRLCAAGEIAAAALGDRTAIYACFRAHRRDLSPACDRVLKNHGY
jgi:hypothetical protein